SAIFPSVRRESGGGVCTVSRSMACGDGLVLTDMTASSSPVSPSTGAVVRFRERLWRIDRVIDDQVFAATPLDGRDTTSRLFATALEDLREARMPFPEAGSAGTFAPQQMLLDAFRVSLIHGTAPIQGLQRSRAVP